MKILVTGGAGFIGSHIVNRFTAYGHEVVVLDNLGHTSCKNRLHKDIKFYMSKYFAPHGSEMEESDQLFYEADISDEGVWKHLPTDFNLVINSAAETHVDESFDRPADFINTNIIGLHNVSKYCADTSTSLIHLGTDEVIGTGEPLYEDSMTLPTNPYSATKAAGESVLHAYGYSYGLDWKVVRLNNTYGTMQFPDKLIPSFINKLNNDKKLPIHGSGKQIRFFLNVEDFVDAVEVVLNDGKTKNIYNVSTDESYSVLLVTHMICEAMGKNVDSNIEYVEDRPFQDMIYLSNSEKLRSIGWSPKRTLEKTLPELVDWYTANDTFFNE